MKRRDIYKYSKSPMPLATPMCLTRQYQWQLQFICLTRHCQWQLQFRLTRQWQWRLPFSLPTEKPEPTPPVLALVSLTGGSPCMAISPMGMASPSRTANSPVSLAVCFVHACVLRVKQTHVENTYKPTPFRKIVCKSAPKGEICRSF